MESLQAFQERFREFVLTPNPNMQTRIKTAETFDMLVVVVVVYVVYLVIKSGTVVWANYATKDAKAASETRKTIQTVKPAKTKAYQFPAMRTGIKITSTDIHK